MERFSEARESKLLQLLSALTLDEKISLVSGRDFWSLPAVERLGIPSLKMSDGPTGLRSTNSEASTVFPVGIALAANWDRGLVQEVSTAIGREAIGHGVDVLLAPGVNIQRTPLGGRNFEYYSEDPYLTGQIGIAYVNGVQSVGVGTSVKHFVANNQEHNRMSGSSNVSERALREIYLAAFEPIIKEAKPWTVMSAYNRVNGIFASEHDRLINKVLKQEWGFDGVVVSDWGAAKSTVGSANGGLDLEMPGPARVFGADLAKALASGEVSEATLDDHVLRVLRLIARCGLLDGNPKQSQAALCTPEHRAIARKAASDGMVLLKNDRGVLPLKEVDSVAIIGALADYPAIQGGGSSQVSPDRIVTPLEGLQEALAGAADLKFERALDPEPRPPILDGRLLRPSEGANEQGLKAVYYKEAGYQGEIAHEALDWRFAKLGFGAEAQSKSGEFSVEWSGVFVPRYSGEHHWLVTHSNPDAELIIADEVLVGEDTDRETEMLFMILPLNRREAKIHLQAGKAYPITIRYSQPGGIRGFNIFNVALREPPPDKEAAVRAAYAADTALVFVGSGTTSETEGEDRKSMALSSEQNELVEAVAKANANTVVIVNTGGPVEMPWADKVAGIVQMWLPGQEGGHAIADVLTGKTNPSGKLPVTFPKRYQDNPTFLHYPGGAQADYGEGLFVGYRYYAKTGTEPLFAFGHGLSYTRFKLSNAAAVCKLAKNDTIEVRLTLSNQGAVTGAETVQIYIENSACPEASAPRNLCAFEKVELPPGRSEDLTFVIPKQAFAYFDEDLNDWTWAKGLYTVHVGTSAKNIQHSFAMVYKT